MAARKQKTAQKKTPRKKSGVQQSSIFGAVAFIGLIGLAAAGWHASFNNNASSAPRAVVVTPAPRPVLRQQALRAVIPTQKALPAKPALRYDGPRPPMPVAPPLHSQPPAAAKAHPYIADRDLPPQGKFAVQNAANVIFARKKTVIYASTDSNSKKIAMVERGQEMRSYGRQGNWHRITIPRTGIIGWAKDDSLTPMASVVRFGLDGGHTASIKRPSQP